MSKVVCKRWTDEDLKFYAPELISRMMKEVTNFMQELPDEKRGQYDLISLISSAAISVLHMGLYALTEGHPESRKDVDKMIEGILSVFKESCNVFAHIETKHSQN